VRVTEAGGASGVTREARPGNARIDMSILRDAGLKNGRPAGRALEGQFQAGNAAKERDAVETFLYSAYGAKEGASFFWSE
jgi:hypothetical protein